MFSKRQFIKLFICVVLKTFLSFGVAEILPDPKFGAPIVNVTVPVGREAILGCIVQDLSTYKVRTLQWFWIYQETLPNLPNASTFNNMLCLFKILPTLFCDEYNIKLNKLKVAWLRVDTQTILTIHSHIITKNKRIGVSHSDHRTWFLHIKDVRPTDRGWYMCQINTDPMKSQLGYLDVVVPPDILDYPTSSDMAVREGSNVSLKCAATGAPQPQIMWRREGGERIQISSEEEVLTAEGPVLNITKVNRSHMGAYLCIASNGVPPTISKRIMLIVHFPPMIWIQNQLVGAIEGMPLTLECNSEAYPKSINYWTREKGEIVPQGGKYEPYLSDNVYKMHMKLTIKSMSKADYGTYKCVSKNSLGDTDGTIKVYQISKKSAELVDNNEISNTIPGTQDLKLQGTRQMDRDDYYNGVSQQHNIMQQFQLLIFSAVAFLVSSIILS